MQSLLRVEVLLPRHGAFYTMRMYLSKFMLIFYALLAFAPQWLEEFAKFPALMAHYQEHCQSNPQITVADFLNQHYGEDYAEHRNQHDHSKLPGKAKHNDTCMHMNVTGDTVLPLQAAVLVQLPLWEEPNNSAVFGQDQNLSSDYLSGIWQPPRA